MTGTARETNRDRVLRIAVEAAGPICDDCLAREAQLNQRQAARAICLQLASSGHVVRDKGTCGMCHRAKLVSWRPETPLAGPEPQIPLSHPEPRADAAGQEVTRRWFWEGNVQGRIVAHLSREGYLIRRVSDTGSREQGKDITAAGPGGTTLWVSVKGYPENSGATQARHWFAGAVLDLILYRHESATAHVALGLPDGFTTYLGLAKRVAWLRKAMPFSVFWVSEDGTVREEQ